MSEEVQESTSNTPETTQESGAPKTTQEATSESGAPEIPESGTILDGKADGEGGDLPQELKYAGKYDNITALEKGYEEIQSLQTKTKESLNAANEKLKGFVGAPEEYTLPEDIKGYSDSVMGSLEEWGKEQGLSQDAYVELITKITAADQQGVESYKQEQMELLGKDADIRIQNINDKWGATFGDEAKQWMQEKAQSAKDVEMFESILGMQSQAVVNPSGTQPQAQVMITREQLSEAMFAKDSAGNMKMQSDPEYKAMVDRMTSKFNSQRGV